MLGAVMLNRAVLQRSSLTTISQVHIPPNTNANSTFLLLYSLIDAYIHLLQVNLNP